MGAREFTDGDERLRRMEAVAAVGSRVYGPMWQTPLAEAISAATGRSFGRARVSQWFQETTPKPVPAWVLEILPAIAREGAARLRVAADELDAMFPAGGAPPGAQGEPEADGEPPQESGPPAAEASPDVEFDLDGFMDRVLEAGPSGPIEGEEAMPVPPPVETTRAWSSHIGWYQAPVRR